MTMSELARRSMLSRHTVLNLLHKAKCGNIITWLMLADGLGMTLDELARKEGRMSKYATCPLCGAHLDHGERCDCAREKRPAEGRARCPLFLSRWDIKERHYLLCVREDGVISAALCYPSQEARDRQYRRLCCDNPLQCPIRAASPLLPFADEKDRLRAQVVLDLVQGTMWARGMADK